MFFSRCIYRLPVQAMTDYWDNLWSQKEFDGLVASQSRKDWWPTMEALLA